MIFHVNCLHMRQFTCKIKPCFLRKKRKLSQVGCQLILRFKVLNQQVLQKVRIMKSNCDLMIYSQNLDLDQYMCIYAVRIEYRTFTMFNLITTLCPYVFQNYWKNL